MKRISFVLLAFVMCISMCACAEPITEEVLIGDWALENDDYIISFEFTDEGRFGFAYLKMDETDIDDFESDGGYYKIDGNKVILTFDKNQNPFDSSELVYKDGKLIIDDHILEKE